MLFRLILLLTVVPIVELLVLLEVHRAVAERTDTATGLVVTIGSVLLTGILGASLARSQGLGVLLEIQRATAQGRFPADSLLDGAMILVGAAMLLMPGFLTDIVGLSFLIPLTRKFYRRACARWLRRTIERNEAIMRVRMDRLRNDDGFGGPGSGRVIDVTPEDGDP